MIQNIHLRRDQLRKYTGYRLACALEEGISLAPAIISHVPGTPGPRATPEVCIVLYDVPVPSSGLQVCRICTNAIFVLSHRLFLSPPAYCHDSVLAAHLADEMPRNVHPCAICCPESMQDAACALCVGNDVLLARVPFSCPSPSLRCLTAELGYAKECFEHPRIRFPAMQVLEEWTLLGKGFCQPPQGWLPAHVDFIARAEPSSVNAGSSTTLGSFQRPEVCTAIYLTLNAACLPPLRLSNTVSRRTPGHGLNRVLVIDENKQPEQRTGPQVSKMWTLPCAARDAPPPPPPYI